ncbi:hypothetical protein LPB142_08240 [Rhodobacter xanthinilyticus]|uniref:Uncharacterized protein n=1 Tax=Rhodobacter xanthinilyticus TaxID=1850250 RepID=A0A1D9MBN7_9RHOB|nr:hypothetical protein [Rhodobacter xanthinilyticus]AOZ69305.1 hypothetical protein LPB142_08240 [Rhodobacter xanthinilyticus]
MTDPFHNTALSLEGPAVDLLPITPSDSADLSQVVVAVMVETAGALRFVSRAGQTRTVTLGDGAILPVGVRRVLATGTTATGIHGFALS